MTKTQLAKRYRVTLNSVSAWLVKGLPHTRDQHGRYRFDRTQVERWREENLSTSPAPAKGATPYTVARTRKETAVAGLREFQLRHSRGEFIEKVAVEREAFRVGRTVRDAIMTVPDKLAALLAVETDATKIHILLTMELRQALDALAGSTLSER